MDKELGGALHYVLSRGVQIHPDAWGMLEEMNLPDLQKVIKEITQDKLRKRHFVISQRDLEEFFKIGEDPGMEGILEILSDPTPRVTSAEGIEGYTSLFTSRYEKLRRIISERPEARMLRSIGTLVSGEGRAAASADGQKRDDVYVAGLLSRRSSDMDRVKITVEDPTGTLDLVIFDEDLKKTAEMLLMDQFLLVRAIPMKGGTYMAKDISVPDIGDREHGRSETDVYAVFVSDLHIGSRYFMGNQFDDFVEWLSGPDLFAKKIRFLLIGGDIVDGVGIYKDQDRELDEKTIEEQLQKTVRILSRIPKNIHVVIMPGNHDPGRRALPQPAIPRKYNGALWNRSNFHMVGNPAVVSLNGVRVLMFHGQSIDDIVKVTPNLSYDRPADVMKHLLRARHLSPIYGTQTPIAPEKEDMMVIDDVPDIFHAGHVHVMGLMQYRGTLIINSGTWQSQTPFQASVGITPTPCIAVMVNLRTMKVSTKSFETGGDPTGT